MKLDQHLDQAPKRHSGLQVERTIVTSHGRALLRTRQHIYLTSTGSMQEVEENGEVTIRGAAPEYLSGRRERLQLMQQVRGLANQAGVGLICFCGSLLALDLFFIAVFSIHRIASEGQDIAKLGSEWHIGHDWSYSEIFGYVKLAIIVSVLALITAKRQRPIYGALMLISIVALLDDALRLHERMSAAIAGALGLSSRALGELISWTILGILLLSAAYVGMVRSPQEDRRNGFVLVAAFTILALFVVVADLAHVVVLHAFKSPVVDALLTVLEDGGEQITLTLIVGLALLVHRDLRSREPGASGK